MPKLSCLAWCLGRSRAITATEPTVMIKAMRSRDYYYYPRSSRMSDRDFDTTHMRHPNQKVKKKVRAPLTRGLSENFNRLKKKKKKKARIFRAKSQPVVASHTFCATRCELTTQFRLVDDAEKKRRRGMRRATSYSYSSLSREESEEGTRERQKGILQLPLMSSRYRFFFSEVWSILWVRWW